MRNQSMEDEILTPTHTYWIKSQEDPGLIYMSTLAFTTQIFNIL